MTAVPDPPPSPRGEAARALAADPDVSASLAAQQRIQDALEEAVRSGSARRQCRHLERMLDHATERTLAAIHAAPDPRTVGQP